MSIHYLIQRLQERLPELEWKLSHLDKEINPAILPRGLFQYRQELTLQTCMDEIKADLRAMEAHDKEHVVRYLVSRVEQKINVMVRICQKQLEKTTTQAAVAFGVQAISTRQQWLKTLQMDIDLLGKQQQALAQSVLVSKTKNNNQVTLHLEKELGEATRRLTLAKETLLRASS